ncbi:ankyrin repeat domain-containing protein [Candidatus Berkiella cookevillensis]|uniref:Ankyrin repeat domain-containing protein n=1 Tax=Candidatus Berkiella cookevillensis TaxID=437022 RepID=A0A0Q9YHS8_9GAMM|nr:ankyrin repeat domain-containing protein [Candidatus Berkiella cookevillensis]MCS5708204.1 ankyrin repeat domain-containing protein [Candidatus Berkiella cookevillensis]
MPQKSEPTTQNIFAAIKRGNITTLKSLYNTLHKNAKTSTSKSIGKASHLDNLFFDQTKKVHTSKLLYAVLCKQEAAVRFLLNQNSDYYDMYNFNEAQENPVIKAIQTQQLNIFKAFIQHHDFLKQCIKDKQGNSIIHYIGRIQDKTLRQQFAQCLIEAEFDIQLKNYAGKRANHIEEFETLEKTYHRSLKYRLKQQFRKAPRLYSFFATVVFASALILPLCAIYSLAFAIPYIMVGIIAATIPTAWMQKNSPTPQSIQMEAEFVHAIKNNTLTKKQIKTFVLRGGNLNKLSTISITLGNTLGNLSALELAVLFLKPDMLTLLMTSISDHDKTIAPKFSQRLLLLAIGCNRPEMVSLLLPHYENIDFSIRKDLTPIMLALHLPYKKANEEYINNQYEIVEMLLKRKADLGKNTLIAIVNDAIKRDSKTPCTIGSYARYLHSKGMLSEKIAALCERTLQERKQKQSKTNEPILVQFKQRNTATVKNKAAIQPTIPTPSKKRCIR